MTVCLLLLLLSLGCNRSETNTKVVTNFRTGISGLEIKFLENAPPPELFYTKDSQFPIGIQIQNKGAEQAYGVIALNFDGYITTLSSGNAQPDEKDPSLYKIASSQGSFLEGKRKENPNGDLQIVTMTASPAAINPQTEQFKSNIIATSCYNYKTEFTPDVCMDTDIFIQRQLGKACKVQDITGSGQGAPVVVEKVQVQMLPRDNGVAPQFTITLKNSGNGEVIRYGKFREVCSQKISDTALNFNLAQVYAQLSGQELDCYPKKEQILPGEPAEGEETLVYGYARFKDKTATIVCRLNSAITKPEGSFVSKLRIVVYYGYTTSIAKEVLIKVPLPRGRYAQGTLPTQAEQTCDPISGLCAE